MPVTLDGPIGTEALGGEGLDRETLAELNASFPEPNDTPAPESAPVETPAATPSETPAPETPAPEPSETRSSATATPPPANEPARQPTAWQPGDDERLLAQQLGLPEAVVRGFSSATDFYRYAAWQRGQQPAATSPAPKPNEPDPVQQFLDDPLQDESVKAVVRMQHQQLAEMRQQLGQQGQGFQQHQQALQQAESQRQVAQFNATVDEHFGDFFGKVSDPDQTKQVRRQSLMQAFSDLAQVGRVKDFSQSAVALAFSLAYPEESQQQLRRSLIQKAQRQGDMNLGGGSNQAADKRLPASGNFVANDPGMQKLAGAAGIPVE